MNRPFIRTAALVALAGVFAGSHRVMPASSRDAEFDALVDDFLPRYWRAFPTEATGVGVHTFDGELEDLSAAGVADKLALFQQVLARVKAIPPRDLSADKRVDREILLKALEWQILDYRQIRSWTKNPGLYNDLASYSLFLLFLRESAPAAERARAAISRLQKIPALLAAGRVNLTGQTPALAVETAIRDTKGTLNFIKGAVGEFLMKSFGGEAKMAAQIEPATAGALAAVEEYLRFLEKDLGPRAQGSYALGRKLYIQKSTCLHHVELEPEAIAARGLAEVRRLQAEMTKVAAQMAPGKSLAEALAMAAADHPPATELIAAYRARQSELREFVAQHKLVTIPPDDKLVIRETPEFARSMILAAVFPAGSFETVDLTTYYVVTPIDTSRSSAEQEEHLREHSLAAIDVVSIHEAYPGHHVQLLQARQAPSNVRKLVANSVFMEGWAHYAEEMMVDAGYRADPGLRLFMLKDALLRACRMHLDPLLGTGQKTYEYAKDFYAKEGYQSAVTAEIEARRVALSPATVYVYTLGKLWIQDLAAAEKKRLGPKFRLGAFHDRLLAQGSVPLPLLARTYFQTEVVGRK